MQLNTDRLADNLCIAFLAAQLHITIASAAKQYKSLSPPSGAFWKAMAQYLGEQNEVKSFEAQESEGDKLPVTDPFPLYLRLAWKATLENVTIQTAQKRYGKDPIGSFWVRIAQNTVSDLYKNGPGGLEIDLLNNSKGNDFDDDAETVIYDRRPFTPWIVEVIKDEGGLWKQYEAVYRATMRDSRECEQFTLFERNSEYAPVQIRIFKNDEISVDAFEAALVTIKRRPKRIITVELLFDEERLQIELLAEEASLSQRVLDLMEEKAALGQTQDRLSQEWLRFSSTLAEEDEELANDPFLRTCFYSGAFALSKLTFALAQECDDESSYEQAMNGVLAELREFTDEFTTDTHNPLDPIHRSAEMDTAEPGENVTNNPVTPKELETLIRHPRFDLLATNLFIAYLTDSQAATIEEAAILADAVTSHRKQNRLGEFWYSLAAMVEQQMHMHGTGTKLVSLKEDRLQGYEEGDAFPRYLLAAHTAFEQNLSLAAYSIMIGGIDTKDGIGSYWRWLAQKVRREFGFLDADHQLDGDLDSNH